MYLLKVKCIYNLHNFIPFLLSFVILHDTDLYHGNKETARTNSTIRLESTIIRNLCAPILSRTILTRDRRKYCQKVQVRRHGSQHYSYSSSTRNSPLPLSFPFQTIRFIRKSCTRNRRSREREHVCERIDGSFRERSLPPRERFAVTDCQTKHRIRYGIRHTVQLCAIGNSVWLLVSQPGYVPGMLVEKLPALENWTL